MIETGANDTQSEFRRDASFANTIRYGIDITLKLGKVHLSTQQLKRISLMIATDLKNFAETFYNSQNLTAKEVYFHLQKINKTTARRS